jgi:RNase P subunit RPR2
MKCPKCDKELSGDDIEDIKIRGTRIQHFAYVCKKCNYIIGFGTALP